MSNTAYNQTFFVVPGHILNIEGLTLQLLRFYEAIFQFWNHGKTCFLSNKAIKDKTGIKSMSTINDAFQFFEKRNLMLRKVIDGKRYIIQPEQKIEIKEENNSNEESPEGYRSSDRGVSTQRYEGIDTAIHNNKNLNKESNIYTYAREDDGNLNNQGNENQQKNSDELFEQFYEVYPIKKGKNKSRVAWHCDGLDQIFDEIMEKLKQQLEEDADFEEGYAPHPFTYITQQRWTDEIKVKKKTTKSKRERLDHDSLDWAKDFSEHLSFGLL